MTERKTIYLDDALEAIRKLPNAGIHWFVFAEAVFNSLLELPPAQPEPIRCCECKWWDITSPASTMVPTFYKCRCFENHYTEANEFCSRAER